MAVSLMPFVALIGIGVVLMFLAPFPRVPTLKTLLLAFALIFFSAFVIFG